MTVSDPSSEPDRRAIEEGMAIVEALLGTPLEARADQIMDGLLQRYPSAAAVHIGVANLRRRQGRLDQALRAARQALACDPGSRLARRLIGALSGGAVEAGDTAAAQPAPFTLHHDFLDVATHGQLLSLALAHEPGLAPSAVGGINPRSNWRRSKVDVAPARFEALAQAPIVAAAHRAMAGFAMPAFDFGSIQMQFTAHNDGDFYKAHCDWGEGGSEHRRLTFVYYFNRQPRGFSGGDLLLFDSTGDGRNFAARSFTRVVPRDNMLIVFPSRFWHEVEAVRCDGGYADSRFTLNGWIGVAA